MHSSRSAHLHGLGPWPHACTVALSEFRCVRNGLSQYTETCTNERGDVYTPLLLPFCNLQTQPYYVSQSILDLFLLAQGDRVDPQGQGHDKLQPAASTDTRPVHHAGATHDPSPARRHYVLSGGLAFVDVVSSSNTMTHTHAAALSCVIPDGSPSRLMDISRRASTSPSPRPTRDRVAY